MADRINIEMGGKLVPILLQLAREQGRTPDDVVEDALLLYLRSLGAQLEPSIGRDIKEIYIEGPGGPQRDPFLSLLDRMSSRFDLDEDEAMRIAVEEQHAFRRERADREVDGR